MHVGIAEIGIAWGLMHIPVMMHYPVKYGTPPATSHRCLSSFPFLCSTQIHHTLCRLLLRDTFCALSCVSFFPIFHVMTYLDVSGLRLFHSYYHSSTRISPCIYAHALVSILLFHPTTPCRTSPLGQSRHPEGFRRRKKQETIQNTAPSTKI